MRVKRIWAYVTVIQRKVTENDLKRTQIMKLLIYYGKR
jgi:hypothetical protein